MKYSFLLKNQSQRDLFIYVMTLQGVMFQCLSVFGVFFPPKTKIVITLSNQNHLMKNI